MCIRDRFTPLILILMAMILWSVGIHGTFTVSPIYLTLYASMNIANISYAAQAGTTAGSPYPYTWFALFENYGCIGGTGNTLALIVAILILSRKKGWKRDDYTKTAKIGFIPVSYTHLDVYKRQTYWFGQWGIPLEGILGSVVHAFSNINTVAMGLIGIVVVLASSYNYATQLRMGKEGDKCVPLVASIVSLIAYIATIPNALQVGDNTITAFQINFFNYEGMFAGMIIGLLSSYMYYRLINSNFTIKLPGQVPPMVLNSFMSIIPFLVIITVFSVVKEVVLLAGFESLQQLITQFIISPLNGIGTGLPAVIIVIIIMQLLWFFGVHGFSIMWGLISVLWMPIFYEHIQLYVETGSFAAIKEIAPNTLCNVYAMIGGSGSTLEMCIRDSMCSIVK